jgi:four helix bundle protein
MQNERKYDLEDRLINFTCLCIAVVELLPNTIVGNAIAKQLVRSAMSPSLNYGEAQGAESKADFKHKNSIVLKELRETKNCLRIINQKPIVVNETVLLALKEASELVAIFAKIIQTLKSQAK